jgi:hypothetical protein
MPGRTGYEICQYLKMSPRHRHVRVILTAGVLESFDEERARQVSADGTLKKPFEASALVAAVKPLAEAAVQDRASAGKSAGTAAPAPEVKVEVPFVAVVDSEHIRAAVTVALDASLEKMVDEITRRVLATMRAGNAEPRAAASRVLQPRAAEARVPQPRIAEPAPPEPMLAPPQTEQSQPPTPPALPAAVRSQGEPVRRVTPMRVRSGSILGLDIGKPEPPTPDPE